MTEQYDKVPDEVLKQISEGGGHVYNHEGRAMARELLEFRKQRGAASAAASPGTGTAYGFSWGPGSPP